MNVWKQQELTKYAYYVGIDTIDCNHHLARMRISNKQIQFYKLLILAL